jgi:hypothetical protein
MSQALSLEEQILRAIDGEDPDVLRGLMREQDEIKKIKSTLGPQTKEELWQWMKDRVGIELSTVAVCSGHSSQLDLAWEVYNFEVNNVLWVLNRGGGKTSLVSWIDACQAEYFPGFAAFTIGANRTQGDRKYEYMLPLVVEGGVIGGKELDHVIRSIATRTQWKNGSSVEIAQGSSPENANGPRTPRLHRDEVELMDPETYKQAGNIPAGRMLRDGRTVPAQILDTSTMKQAEGRVDKAIQAYRLAITQGKRPRQQVRIACVFEVAAENPTCRSVPEEERRARLIELGRDPSEICDCHTWESDVWPSEDGGDELDETSDESRTLESVCQGRFFRSRGHKPFDDITTLFLENPRETWEAEQECSQPSREGTYLKSYSQARHGIRGYEPDPENGPIFQGVDWGSDDEAAVIWFQELEREVRVHSYTGDGYKRLPIGAVVAFAEIYRAGIGNVALGHLVIDREAEWIMKYPGWRVHERYPDSAGLSARLDWRDHLGLETASRIKKDFKEEVKYIRSRIGNRGKFYIDIPECEWFDKSIRSWRQVNGREVHDSASHMLAAFRYFEHNWQVVDRRTKKQGKKQPIPVAADDEDERVRERESELVTSQSRGEPIEILTAKKNDWDTEDLGVAGAEDSPLRQSGSSMGGESDWRSSFGGIQR